jgi:hypothetical protein
MRKRYLSLFLAAIALVAALGSSLGLVAARVRPAQDLGVGFNLIGGPLDDNVTPATFLACLPAGSWDALYTWDAQTQTWKHFFNPADVPAYVNNAQLGGIAEIPRLAGVVLIMGTAVPDPFFKDFPAEACP